MSKVSAGSRVRCKDESLTSERGKLLTRCSGVPRIEDILNAMMKETDAFKGH